MAEFPLVLVPVRGVLHIHYTGCDHPAARGPRYGKQSVAATSIETALTQFHTGWRGGAVPSEVVTHDCARNVPRTEVTPFSWEELHAVYVQRCARYVEEEHAEARTRAISTHRDLLRGAYGSPGAQPLPGWSPRPMPLVRHLRAAALFTLWDGLLATVPPDPRGRPERIVRALEDALNATDDSLALPYELDAAGTGSFGPEYGRVEQSAARHFCAQARDLLAPVHAHRLVNPSGRDTGRTPTEKST